MIQIRKKRQLLQSQCRRQFLNSYFCQKRKQNLLNLSICPQPLLSKQTFSITHLIHLSCLPNGLLQQIRNNSFLNTLSISVEKCILQNNSNDRQYLLVLIGNLIKDQLRLEEKESLFQNGIRLVQAIGMEKENHFQNKNYNNNNAKQYNKLVKMLGNTQPQILIYFLAQAFTLYPCLSQIHLCKVQSLLYPCFIHTILLTLQTIPSPKQLQFTQQFNQDISLCFHQFFDSNQEDYQMANVLKAKRNQGLFRYLVEKHWEMVENERIKEWKNVEKSIFWFYDKLTNYYTQLTSFFDKEEMLALVFYDIHVKQTVQKHKFSILTSIIQHNPTKPLLQTLLISDRYSFFSLLSSPHHFQCLSLISSILLSPQHFPQLFMSYWQKMILYSVEILNPIITTKIIDWSLIRQLIKVLYLILERGDHEEVMKKTGNFYRSFFKKEGGMKLLEQLETYIDYNQIRDQPDLQDVIQPLDYIILNDYQDDFQDN